MIKATVGSWLWVWGRDTRDVTEAAPGLPPPPPFPSLPPPSSRIPFQDGTPGLSWGQPDLTDLQPDLCPLATHCRGHAPKVWPLPRTLALSQRACKPKEQTPLGGALGTTSRHKTVPATLPPGKAGQPCPSRPAAPQVAYSPVIPLTLLAWQCQVCAVITQNCH